MKKIIAPHLLFSLVLLLINIPKINAQHGYLKFPTYGNCSDGPLTVTSGVFYTDNVRAKLKYVYTPGLYYVVTWKMLRAISTVETE
jgi:hypothetical protein